MRVPFVIAVVVLLGLLLLLYYEVRRFPGPPKWGRPPVWTKRIRVAVAAILVLIGSLVFWGFFIEPNRLLVHEQTIQIDSWPKQLNGFRVAVVSDIHAGSPFIDDAKLRLIVERTNQLQPELIVVLGDYMTSNSWHGHRVEPEVFAAVLKGFHAPLGVYSVLGNHDWWYDGRKVRRALEQNGIRVLDDEAVEVKARGTS